MIFLFRTLFRISKLPYRVNILNRGLCSFDKSQISDKQSKLQSVKLCSHTDFILKDYKVESRVRSLVILVGWLNANDHHLEKYIHLWHQRNCDVLRVRMRWRDLIRPASTLVPCAQRITEVLNEMRFIYPIYVFHTFSSGCYFYAEVINAIQKNPDKYANLIRYLRCTIFDSLLFEMEQSVQAQAQLMLRAPWLARQIAKLATCYYNATKGHTLNRFLEANKVIANNPYQIPGMILCSRKDPFTDVSHNFLLVETWTKKGTTAYAKCWYEAPHVQNYRFYPEEYAAVIDEFLKEVGIDQLMKQTSNPSTQSTNN